MADSQVPFCIKCGAIGLTTAIFSTLSYSDDYGSLMDGRVSNALSRSVGGASLITSRKPGLEPGHTLVGWRDTFLRCPVFVSFTIDETSGGYV